MVNHNSNSFADKIVTLPEESPSFFILAKVRNWIKLTMIRLLIEEIEEYMVIGAA